jgi:hypothetical protein
MGTYYSVCINRSVYRAKKMGRITMYSKAGVSRWEWAWIVPLSVVLSASINAALAVAVYKLL